MRFADGLQCYWAGVRLLGQPGFRAYLIVPAVLGLILIFGGLAWVVGPLIDQLTPTLPSWLNWLSNILVPLMYLMAVILLTWGSGLLLSIIMSPFLGGLAQRASNAQTPASNATADGGSILAAITRERQKIVYHLPRLLGLFLVSLIPGLNVLAPLLWASFGAWMMAVQFADIQAENEGWDFPHSLTRLRAHRPGVLAFGLCANLSLAVPLVNFLMIPVAVAGGAILQHRMGPRTKH